MLSFSILVEPIDSKLAHHSTVYDANYASSDNSGITDNQSNHYNYNESVSITIEWKESGEYFVFCIDMRLECTSIYIRGDREVCPLSLDII